MRWGIAILLVAFSSSLQEIAVRPTDDLVTMEVCVRVKASLNSTSGFGRPRVVFLAEICPLTIPQAFGGCSFVAVKIDVGRARAFNMR